MFSLTVFQTQVGFFNGFGLMAKLNNVKKKRIPRKIFSFVLHFREYSLYC